MAAEIASETRERVKQYWDERAKQYLSKPAATTEDVWLRELEINTITHTLTSSTIPLGTRVLDVGCGDGYSTLKLARSFAKCSFLGIDYSENMIHLARERSRLEPETKNVEFAVGDVMELKQTCSDSSYDVVISDRCLINLDSFDSQSHAIAQIGQHTKPGGYYLAIENFIEGHEAMNRARAELGLPAIPVRWHNIYFTEAQFLKSVGRFFDEITFKDFSSSYYFATRVIYSAMCQMRGQKPDYNHEIHQLAIRLPWIGQFSPIRMAVMRRKRTHGNNNSGAQIS